MIPTTVKNSNHVTLFSSGMGHFRRTVFVPAGGVTPLSIPFKRDHIADVLESLSISGNVRYVNPPNFTPTNSNATSLQINSSNTFFDLFTSLSGAKIKVHFLFDDIFDQKYLDEYEIEIDALDNEEYVLMGLEPVNFGKEGQNYVILAIKDGEVHRFPQELVNIEFVDESIKSEISKALAANLQKIKPDSTFLDLTITGIDLEESPYDETAIVQYKIPVAAWKMRYNLRQEGERFLLEGTAIIDNNTDEDWNDTFVSVVTGNPISFFSPDMASIVVPERQTVNIIESHALKSVRASAGLEMACGSPLRSAAPIASSSQFRNAMSFGMSRNIDADEQDYCEASSNVDTQDVGDFCVFTSREPVNLNSKRSAIVPMFTVPLTTAGAILLYKEESHNTRPFRAVKFKNTTNYSLGKGKVVLYRDNLFVGEAVLETSKPGENQFLPHCLENGVKITKTPKGHEQKLTALHLASGIGCQEITYTACTEYVVCNRKDEAFKVLIEHRSKLSQDENPVITGIETRGVEKITDGHRIYFDLGQNETVTFKVSEKHIHVSETNIVGNYRWVLNNVVNPKHPLLDNVHIRRCVDVQCAIDKVDETIKSQKDTIANLNNESESLRKNIESIKLAVKDKDSDSFLIQSKWIVALDEADNNIRKIRTLEIPNLENSRKSLVNELELELKKLTASWQA